MSETKGRCRREITAAYESTRYKPSDSDMLVADAIDRLAADVASIKEKVDAVSPEDVRHFVESEKAWVALVTEQRDAAIRERDQWREEARIAVINRDEARAEVERLNAELAARQTDGNSPKTSDSLPAAPQPAAPACLTNEERGAVAFAAASFRGHEIAGNLKEMADQLDALLARAGSPPSQTAAGWLTDEERHILGAHLQSLRDQRRAMERGGQTLGYSADPCGLKREADAIDNILARAGSPPVVEVPELGFLGDMTGREQGIVLAYRDALDAAGVKWKEVGRE